MINETSKEGYTSVPVVDEEDDIKDSPAFGDHSPSGKSSLEVESGTKECIYEKPEESQVWLLLTLALPLAGSQAASLLQGFASAAFVGSNLDRHALTAFSIATLTANLASRSIIDGFLGALDVLAARAFGAGDYAHLGVLVQTSLLLCAGLCLLIFPFLWNAADVLLFLKQPEESVALARQFLRLYIISVPSLIVASVQRRYLRAQGIVSAFVPISFIVLALHFGYLYLFILHLNLGFLGVAIAYTCTTYTTAALTAVYTLKFAPCQHTTWTGWNLSKAMELKTVKAYIRIAIPSILTNNEWWYWEMIGLFVGRLGEVPLAAHTVAYNVIPIAYMLSVSVGLASTTRISTLIGEKRFVTARKVAGQGLIIGTMVGILLGAVSYFLRVPLLKIFAGEDVEVLNAALEIWPLVCVYMILDALAGGVGGVLRGLAAHLALTISGVINFWIIGLPIMYIWTFTFGHGLIGIWQSMFGSGIAGVSIQLLLAYVFLQQLR